MEFDLNKKQRKYIREQIECGGVKNANQLVREALDLHADYSNRKLSHLRAEIEKGWNAPKSKNSILDILNKKKNG
jgi:antitoxin ParD1/3/4